jgi:hypothetical protein
MTHLRAMTFLPLVAFLLAGVQVTEKVCEDRSDEVVNTSVWKPVKGPLNKLACMKAAVSVFEPILRLIHG